MDGNKNYLVVLLSTGNVYFMRLPTEHNPVIRSTKWELFVPKDLSLIGLFSDVSVSDLGLVLLYGKGYGSVVQTLSPLKCNDIDAALAICAIHYDAFSKVSFEISGDPFDYGKRAITSVSIYSFFILLDVLIVV